MSNKNLVFLETDQPTATAVGLIQLHYSTNEAKAIIAYIDENDDEVIWLQAHNYLSYPGNQHKHFSIEAADSAGLKQTRLGVGYGADVVDVTVNQADLIINRNTALTNGNIVMQGGGGGGVIKHANSLDIYPSYTTNSTLALRTSYSSSQLHLSVLGDTTLYLDESLSLTGNLLMPSAGVINFNGGDVTLTHSTDTLTIAGGTLVTADIALSSGSAIKTKTTAASSFVLQARDVDGGFYVNFATLTANNTPTFTISPTTLTMGGRALGLQGTDVASANDLTLGEGNVFEVTGTTQINAITTSGWQNGSRVILLFTSTPTVKNNTAGGGGTSPLLLQGSVDLTPTAGSTLTLVLSEIGGTQAWREVSRMIS